ncbi:uncharacterized protein [Dysidea avara]|uniref:uncharacterized protein isoform X3 n=1 Tax=Dysidea avara TaxID=196820 RepID=UPI0033214787
MASSTIVLICSIILCYMVGNSLATPTNIEDTEPKVSSIEPAQCYRRLVCDLDTGIDSSKENDDIETPTATTESQHRLSLTNNIVQKQNGNPTIHVMYTKPKAEFDVTFYNNHLNVEWSMDYENVYTGFTWNNGSIHEERH